MDFDVGDDVRPRFQFQSGPLGSDTEEREVNKIQVAICAGFGVLLLALAWFQTGLLQFLSLWLALSLVIGPFAPSSVTGGDCRVGGGEPLPEVETLEVAPAEPERRNKGRKSDANIGRVLSKENLVVPSQSVLKEANGKSSSGSVFDRSMESTEKEWTGEEIELLRKQLAKVPQGTLQRWQVITESFGGSHGMESVIRMSKLLREKKFSDADSYAKFIAQRKGGEKGIDSPLSQRWESESTPSIALDTNAKSKSDWTDAEDKALVSALKVFSKDTAMRWDKVAVAVPGRSKVQCFRRFSELRDTFRTAKMDSNAGSMVQGVE